MCNGAAHSLTNLAIACPFHQALTWSGSLCAAGCHLATGTTDCPSCPLFNFTENTSCNSQEPCRGRVTPNAHLAEKHIRAWPNDYLPRPSSNQLGVLSIGRMDLRSLATLTLQGTDQPHLFAASKLKSSCSLQ